MFDDVFRTSLERRLFLVVVILSVITLTTGAAAVYQHEHPTFRWSEVLPGRAPAENLQANALQLPVPA